VSTDRFLGRFMSKVVVFGFTEDQRINEKNSREFLREHEVLLLTDPHEHSVPTETVKVYVRNRICAVTLITPHNIIICAWQTKR
jgi:hypothetical protein